MEISPIRAETANSVFVGLIKSSIFAENAIYKELQKEN